MNRIVEITKKYYPLTDEQTEELTIIAELLTEMNGVLNLTALKSEEEIAVLHFFDSLTLLKTGLFSGKSIIDIGCGGGFPSFPLAVCSQDCNVTANDSTAKKLHFVAETAKKAGITNLSTLEGRAEELAHTVRRESFDIAVARGVAKLNILCELCLPLVKKGGHFIAMKGNRGAEELADAERAIKTLGGRTVNIINNEIPLFDRTHTLIIIEKINATSKEYPRQYSKIIKKPL
ncbi:MAG: 16S rRNA (guanine(527)-N(7))-methyltransferase RsmG [Firmicutes bacterium HGW-Firmicutes-21]|nr:MAG: 16S rRNA (guanine(527)-N(7))-methyltransferase RsmG [Firmicutes bacterium HGW-Firmicutes-21]